MQTAPPDVSTAEKDFYLKEFRGKSLLFALRAKDVTAPKNRDVVQEVLRTLGLNETRMILLVETDASTPERRAVEELHTQLSHTLSGIPAPVLLSPRER